MEVNPKPLTPIQEEPPKEQQQKPRSSCGQILGRICADWTSPLACTLFLGGTSLAIYAFVKKNNLLGIPSTVSAAIGVVLYLRVAYLAPNGRLAENTAVLGKRVRDLSLEQKQFTIDIGEGRQLVQVAKDHVEESKEQFKEAQNESANQIKTLNETVEEFKTALQASQLQYASLKAKLEQMPNQMREQVGAVSKVTTALALTNQSLKALQPAISLSEEERKKAAITIQNTKAVNEFNAANASQEDLIKHLGQSVQVLVATKDDLQKLETSLKELVATEQTVSSQGAKQLAEMSAKLIELENMMAAKAKEALELEQLQKKMIHV